MSGTENEGVGDADSMLRDAVTPDGAAAAVGVQHESNQSGGEPHCLIGLLDGQGRLVWANRCQRSGSLHSLSALLGRDLHGWLHPRCMLLQCPLAAALADCWAVMRREAFCEAPLRDALTNRLLHLCAWRVQPQGGATMVAEEALAIVVVVDVSKLQVPDRTRRAADRELEVRMLRRTEALALEKQNLESELVCCQAAEEHMRVSRAQLAEAARRLMSTQELERIWVARQLRDLVIQTLGAVKYQLEAGGRAAPSAITRLQEAMGDIDAIATSIRPSILDDFGAVSAIQWLCREFSKSHSTLQLRETISVADDAIPKRLQTAVFRSVQELLSNVAARSQARHVIVSLSKVSGELVLEVLEDGFESSWADGEESLDSEQGIFAARMHAELSGARFSLGAIDGGAGIRMRIQWPLASG